MAFGIDRKELSQWKKDVTNGNIAFLTHYWQDPRFPGCNTVTKVGCANLVALIRWGEEHNLKEEWIDHHPKYPHFDLFGATQKSILLKMELFDHLKRFNL